MSRGARKKELTDDIHGDGALGAPLRVGCQAADELAVVLHAHLPPQFERAIRVAVLVLQFGAKLHVTDLFTRGWRRGEERSGNGAGGKAGLQRNRKREGTAELDRPLALRLGAHLPLKMKDFSKLFGMPSSRSQTTRTSSPGMKSFLCVRFRCAVYKAFTDGLRWTSSSKKVC